MPEVTKNVLQDWKCSKGINIAVQSEMTAC